MPPEGSSGNVATLGVCGEPAKAVRQAGVVHQAFYQRVCHCVVSHYSVTCTSEDCSSVVGCRRFEQVFTLDKKYTCLRRLLAVAAYAMFVDMLFTLAIAVTFLLER